MSNLLQQDAQPQENCTITYIYGLVDPFTEYIRYVGKSNAPKKRLRGHLFSASTKKKNHRNDWIRSLFARGEKPRLILLQKIHISEWQDAEQKWIAYYRSIPGYPPLTNNSPGGEGMEFMREEIRRKISKTNSGVAKSAETRRRCSEGQRNRWANASEREREKMLTNLRNAPRPEITEKSKVRARNAPRPANTSSRFRNVVKDMQHGIKCWRAGCIINGKQVCIGFFRTEEEAARARDRYFLRHIGENVILNFPRVDYPTDPSDIVIESRQRLPSRISTRNTSGFKGIFKNGKNGWAASISHMGIRYRLGTHRTQEAAARAFDRKAIELLGDDAVLNFPRSDYE